MYETNEYPDEGSNSLSTIAFDGGYVIAETFKEAYDKVLEHLKEAWGKKVRLEIIKLVYEHEINIS